MTTNQYLKAIIDTFERKMTAGEALRDTEIQAYCLALIAQRIRV